jgi:hypothetical protein
MLGCKRTTPEPISKNAITLNINQAETPIVGWVSNGVRALEQPDGSTKEDKEWIWGYGSGIVSAILPEYGDLILAEYTQPFNENDVTYYHPL